MTPYITGTDEVTTNGRIIAVTVDVNRLKGDLRREHVVTRNDEFINWVSESRWDGEAASSRRS